MRYGLSAAEERICQRETGRALKLVPDVEKNECSAE
jgi:hypothetical protein